VAECTAAQVAEALTRPFEGYVVPVDVSARGYEQRSRPENVDPFSSYVYVREKRPVAIILIARRGWTSRVAAMAVVPEERGRGFGKSLVHRISRLPCTRG
jgi:GNAT superfamily N-acetyltransferase